jgi:transcriptional regulator with XRE-family HTH domain
MAKKSDVYEQMGATDLIRIEELGDRLRIARQRRGWTQKDLALKSGMSEGSIKNIEQGSPSIPIGFITQLMSVFVLSEELELLAQPHNDSVGKSIEVKFPRLRVRKRLHVSTPLDDYLEDV